MTAFTPQKGEAGWGSSHPLNMDYDILRLNGTWLFIYMESCFQSFQLQGPSAYHRTQPGNQIPSLSTCFDFSFSRHIQTNPSKSSIDVSHQHQALSTHSLLHWLSCPKVKMKFLSFIALLCSISLACARVLTPGLIDAPPSETCNYLQTNGSIFQEVSHHP